MLANSIMSKVKDLFCPSWPRWIPLVLFCFLAAHGVGLFNASDDSEYLTWASCFARQVPLAARGASQASVRLVVWLPTWAVSLLGFSMYWSSVIATSTLAFALVAVITFIWRRDYDPKIPIIAAAILATNPLFLSFSTNIYPEVYLTAFMVMAMIQYQRCSIRNRDHFQWLFVGMWIGLAALAKQTGVLLFPILVIHRVFVVSRKGPLKACIWSVLGIGFGGLIVFLLSVAFMAWWFHRPWGLFEVSGSIGPLFTKMPYYESVTGDRLLYFRIFASRGFANLGLILVAAAVASCFGRGAPKLEAITGLVYLGYLMFGSVSLTEYIRPSQHPRYLIPCIPFFAMCAAYQASRIIDAWKRYWTKRKPTFQWILQLQWMTLGLILAFSAMVAIDQVTAPYPFQSHLTLIRGAIGDISSPTFVTASFKRRYAPVLTDDELKALHVFSRDESLPNRYTLLVGWFDYYYDHSAVLQASWPWEHATVTTLSLVISWPRRLLDRMRKRGLAWYRDNAWYSYYERLYRIHFDMNGLKRPESCGPPWKKA